MPLTVKRTHWRNPNIAYYMRATKALTSLRIRAGSSELSLIADTISAIATRAGSYASCAYRRQKI